MTVGKLTIVMSPLAKGCCMNEKSFPPRGKTLVRGKLVGAEVNQRGRRGHAPALRMVYVPFVQIIEL